MLQKQKQQKQNQIQYIPRKLFIIHTKQFNQPIEISLQSDISLVSDLYKAINKKIKKHLSQQQQIKKEKINFEHPEFISDNFLEDVEEQQSQHNNLQQPSINYQNQFENTKINKNLIFSSDKQQKLNNISDSSSENESFYDNLNLIDNNSEPQQSQLVYGLQSNDNNELIDYWLCKYDHPIDRLPEQIYELTALYTEYQYTEENQKTDLHCFKFLKCLGRGGTSEVFLVRHKGSQKIFALKMVKKTHLSDFKRLEQLLRERKILIETYGNEFVTQLHSCFESQEHLNFVLEFYPGGELFFHLQNLKLSEDQAKYFFAEIIVCFEKLHQQKILYRDLKPENIILDVDGHLRLTDFGLSKIGMESEDITDSFCGSPEYMPPEILKRNGYNYSVDFYTIGAFLYELVTGLPPYYANSTEIILQNIQVMELTVPDYLSKDLRELLFQLLDKNVSKRIDSFETIKNNPWLQNVNWDVVRAKQLPPPIVIELKNSYIHPDFKDVEMPSTTQQNTPYSQKNGNQVRVSTHQESLFSFFSYTNEHSQPFLNFDQLNSFFNSCTPLKPQNLNNQYQSNQNKNKNNYNNKKENQNNENYNNQNNNQQQQYFSPSQRMQTEHTNQKLLEQQTNQNYQNKIDLFGNQQSQNPIQFDQQNYNYQKQNKQQQYQLQDSTAEYFNNKINNDSSNNDSEGEYAYLSTSKYNPQQNLQKIGNQDQNSISNKFATQQTCNNTMNTEPNFTSSNKNLQKYNYLKNNNKNNNIQINQFQLQNMETIQSNIQSINSNNISNQATNNNSVKNQKESQFSCSNFIQKVIQQQAEKNKIKLKGGKSIIYNNNISKSSKQISKSLTKIPTAKMANSTQNPQMKKIVYSQNISRKNSQNVNKKKNSNNNIFINFNKFQSQSNKPSKGSSNNSNNVSKQQFNTVDIITKKHGNFNKNIKSPLVLPSSSKNLNHIFNNKNINCINNTKNNNNKIINNNNNINNSSKTPNLDINTNIFKQQNQYQSAKTSQPTTTTNINNNQNISKNNKTYKRDLLTQFMKYQKSSGISSPQLQDQQEENSNNNQQKKHAKTPILKSKDLQIYQEQQQQQQSDTGRITTEPAIQKSVYNHKNQKNIKNSQQQLQNNNENIDVNIGKNAVIKQQFQSPQFKNFMKQFQAQQQLNQQQFQQQQQSNQITNKSLKNITRQNQSHSPNNSKNNIQKAVIKNTNNKQNYNGNLKVKNFMSQMVSPKNQSKHQSKNKKNNINFISINNNKENMHPNIIKNYNYSQQNSLNGTVPASARASVKFEDLQLIKNGNIQISSSSNINSKINLKLLDIKLQPQQSCTNLGVISKSQSFNKNIINNSSQNIFGKQLSKDSTKNNLFYNNNIQNNMKHII